MATAGEAASPAGSGGGRRRRVLLFPVPFQGHLTPMLQLAGALHARGGGGLGVTVFYAAFNAPDPARHPAAFRFVPVGEGVPSADLLPSGSDADFAGALLRLNDHLREPFRDRLRQALAEEEEGGGAAACLVVDSNLRGMQLVAEELGVPTLVLRTGAAACLVAYMAFPALCDKGLLPPASQGDRSIDHISAANNLLATCSHGLSLRCHQLASHVPISQSTLASHHGHTGFQILKRVGHRVET